LYLFNVSNLGSSHIENRSFSLAESLRGNNVFAHTNLNSKLGSGSGSSASTTRLNQNLNLAISIAHGSISTP
jgi:hypothetical protein